MCPTIFELCTSVRVCVKCGSADILLVTNTKPNPNQLFMDNGSVWRAAWSSTIIFMVGVTNQVNDQVNNPNPTPSRQLCYRMSLAPLWSALYRLHIHIRILQLLHLLHKHIVLTYSLNCLASICLVCNISLLPMLYSLNSSLTLQWPVNFICLQGINFYDNIFFNLLFEMLKWGLLILYQLCIDHQLMIDLTVKLFVVD